METPDEDSGEELASAEVPSLFGKVYDTWSEFTEAFDKYCKDTYQTLVKRTSTSRTSRNARIELQHNDRGSEVPQGELFLDDSYPYYLVSYQCTHGGSHRNRGSGKRPRQTIRTIGCKAKVNVVLQRTGNGYRLKVSVHNTSHNHRVGPEPFKRLPKNRLHLDDEELTTVNMLRKVGLSRKKILKYIWDSTSSEPDMVDVHNLLAKLKREEEAGTTVSDRVSETLDRFCENDRFAAAPVDMDRQGGKVVARCITIQTSHMRSLFSAFPEVLLVDATHDTNASRYKLFSFMVHDSMGRGQHVQHALITDERAETLRMAILQFKNSNQSWSEVRCFVVDKDFTEIGVLKFEFPEARVLLCQFHAIKYIQERIGKTEYELDAIQRARLKPIASMIVRAQSEDEYKKCFDYMKHELRVKDCENDEEESNVPVFWNYFLKNWDACREMRCSFLRDNVAHLGNSTNNRLESSWQKIKTLVNRDVDLDETLTSLIWWSKYKEKQFTTEVSRIGLVVDTVQQTRPELARLAQIVSKHAFDIVKEQFDIASQVGTFYTVQTEDNGMFTVSSENTTCHVDSSSWTSYCMLGQTRKLPCRHVMYLRKLRQYATLIPFSHIADRWRFNSMSMVQQFVQQDLEGSGFTEATVAIGTTARLTTQSERYLEARSCTQRIAHTLSTYGTAQFRSALKLADRITHSLDVCDVAAIEKACVVLEAGSAQSAQGSAQRTPSVQATVQYTQPVQANVQSEQSSGDSDRPSAQSVQAGTQHEQSIQFTSHSTQAGTRSSQVDAATAHEVRRNSSSSSDCTLQHGGDTQVNISPGSDASVDSESEEDGASVVETSCNEPSTVQPPVGTDQVEIEISDDSDDSEEIENTLAALEAGESRRRRPRVWPISANVKPPGRPQRTLRQRQFERKKKFAAITAQLQSYEPETDAEKGKLKDLGERFLAERVTFNGLNAYLSKFSVRYNMPSPKEAPYLCIAVHATKPEVSIRNAKWCNAILPLEWVYHCIELAKKFQKDYREKQDAELEFHEILLKFERGKTSMYPSVTADYMYVMGGWHTTREAFTKVSQCIDWIREVDVEEAQLGSLFGDSPSIATQDVCTCVANINVRDDEEKALLDLVHNEAEDIVMTAAIHAMCSDANSRPEALCATTFTTQLMAIGADGEKKDWLLEHDIVGQSEDKIVGALWLNTDHWCGIGISLKTYVFKVMDPRNDKDTIAAVEAVFRNTFQPLLPQEKRWRREVSRFYQQLDEISCGVLVLAFIESFLFESVDIPADTNLLRFRYLLKVLLG